MIASSCDLALIVDESDVVRDVACTAETLAALNITGWRDAPVNDVIVPDSRRILSTMLAAARSGTEGAHGEISHASPTGERVIVRYSAHPSGAGAGVVLLGRDLTPLADLTNRLETAELSLKADDERQSRSEARYQMLFEIASEAFLIVDGATLRIQEANLRAADLFETNAQAMPGQDFASLFAQADRDPVTKALEQVLRLEQSVGLSAMPSARLDPVDMTISRRNGKDDEILLVVFASDNQAAPNMQSVEQFVSMVGKVPLKTLVRENKDAIERSCIEAALKLTGNNRARTAKVLGLSRQALYLKMRRFGLVTAEDDAAEPDAAESA